MKSSDFKLVGEPKIELPKADPASSVLVDTPWIGGDPGKGQVYGWAAWPPRRSILVLRNPDDKAAEFTADVTKRFERPHGAGTKFSMHSPWKADQSQPAVTLRAGEPHTFKIEPFEGLVVESNES